MYIKTLFNTEARSLSGHYDLLSVDAAAIFFSIPAMAFHSKTAEYLHQLVEA
jgi:hypothetical protein